MEKFFCFTAAISASLGMEAKDFNGQMLAFAAGMAATTFGFVLTMIWDVVKRRRDESDKYKTILGLMKTGLANNASIIKWNIDMVETENNSIASQGGVLNAPLASLRANFIGLLSLGVPDVFLREDKFIEKISNIDQNVSLINQRIAARDLYKHSSGFQSGFGKNVAVHNEAIKQHLELFEALNTEMIDIMAKYN